MTDKDPTRLRESLERFYRLDEVMTVNDVGRSDVIDARDDSNATGFQFFGDRPPHRSIHGHVVTPTVKSERQIARHDLGAGAAAERDVG